MLPRHQAARAQAVPLEESGHPFVVFGLIFGSCLVNKLLEQNDVKKCKKMKKMYRKIKKTRLAPPIPKRVLPGRPWGLTNHLLSFGAGGSWSIWSTPEGTPKSAKLAKITKDVVSKFDDFSRCLLEALPKGFGTPK